MSNQYYPRRSHPAQYGEDRFGPPTLERNGSEHRVGRFTSFLLRFLSPTRGTEGVVKTIEKAWLEVELPLAKGRRRDSKITFPLRRLRGKITIMMHNFNDIQIIIMAGGVGSRFWPMSTPDYPKQFIDVMGVGRSLIQLTVDRLKPICPVENMWVVTNEKYIRIVKEQIPDMPVDNILAEPEARNTAPCIAYACWKIQKKHPDANIVVTPSDALVINTSEYQRVLSKALSYTSDKNAIVTIGIKPSRPETGYGYIAAAEPTSVDEIYKVEAFKEKPNQETAEQYLAAGNYYWNAGIFVWNIDTISKAIRTFQPNLASIMDEMAPSFYTEQEKEVVGRLFPTCEKISIDYAVMEKSKEIYTLPAEFGWSDLGSWGSLRTLIPQDEAGNAKVGKDISLYECKNCVVHAADESKVVVQGLNGYIVAEKNGQLLVCSSKEEQRIKEFAQ